jgi:Helix-turn-helix domain
MISVFNGRSRSLGAGGGEEVHVQVSIALRKHLHLFKGAKLGVFMAIALHSDKNGWSHPSTRVLCGETGLNPDTIFKALSELCELRVEGHRVLLRKGVRQSGGQFSNNRYLIFPTEEEISKYETPYLFDSRPTVSEKTDTVKTRHGKNPSRKKPESEKSDRELDPGFKLEPHESSDEDSLKTQQEPHTQPDARAREHNAKRVCVQSKFSLEVLRNYAWASHNYDRSRAAFDGTKREGIRNPEGWAVAAHKSGLYDDLVQRYLDNPSMFERRY